MATSKSRKSGPEVAPATIVAAVIGVIVVIGAIAYFTMFRGPKAQLTPQVQQQNQAMSQDPVLMGKSGDK
jgi:hypothetical protein